MNYQYFNNHIIASVNRGFDVYITSRAIAAMPFFSHHMHHAGLISWPFTLHLHPFIRTNHQCHKPYIHLNPVKVNIVKNPHEYKQFGYIAFQTGITGLQDNDATNPSSSSHSRNQVMRGRNPFLKVGF
ncbi:hypothetical protein [Peribacillus simplex]|uniref:hypothetical protein n=1 Tax=Peribacillus simplex TaxID=1478 RepID=UPI0025A02058|nr:hypothetical protein [Peribacillus simplex]